MTTTKIATCCYCGTRAALVLRGDVQHELSCASCGAPLHTMKPLRSAVSDDARSKASRKMAKVARKARKETKKKKTNKSPARRLLGEAFDLLDDIFD